MPCIALTEPGTFHAVARSWHPGGVEAVFADGHVSFYGDTVDLVVWQALSTRVKLRRELQGTSKVRRWP